MSARDELVQGTARCTLHRTFFPFGGVCPDCDHQAHTFGELPAGNQVKDTNPKDAVGIRKIAFSVLPWQVLCRVALAMMEGAAKYGRHNYRGTGVRASVYFDAIVGRHLTSWWEGNDIDAESGLHEIDKALAGLMVMRDSMLQGNFVDDRPPRGKGVDLPTLNQSAAEILDRYKDKNPKHWTIADTPKEKP